jgi:hypothetical protein
LHTLFTIAGVECSDQPCILIKWLVLSDFQRQTREHKTSAQRCGWTLQGLAKAVKRFLWMLQMGDHMIVRRERKTCLGRLITMGIWREYSKGAGEGKEEGQEGGEQKK